MKRLLIVVGEPEILPNGGSRNNALNEILILYKEYAARVIYVAPQALGEISYAVNGVEFEGISNYSKKSRFIFRDSQDVLRKVISCLNNECDYHIQFRVPSLFSLQMYWIIRRHVKAENISFYVAGDWRESIALNYPDKKILKLLPALQDLTIRRKRCVFTGHMLMNKNAKLTAIGHAFYSTTHKGADVIAPDVASSYERRGICFVGRLEGIKNPYFMLSLAANEELKEKYIFYIMGDGPLRKEMERRVFEMRLTNVQFMGHVHARDKFYKVVDLCKYCVLPSYTEGTAKTLPEMMSKGVIPIGFKKVGSNDYTLRQGGGLVDVDSADQVVSFIDRCDNDFSYYKEKIKEALQYALSHSVDKEMSSMFSFIYK